MPRSGLTLIEMLMATAITLLMMAAVVTLFANLSGSISNRRALIELSGQLRQVRQRLARDLAGCTVPPGPRGLMPWRQRPGEAIGYFEIKEWNHNDWNPSDLVDGLPGNGEIDYPTSFVPSGGDPLSLLPVQRINGRVANDGDVTNGGALGDADDVLALTVRTLIDPFTAIVDVPTDFNADGIFDENGNGVIDDNESSEQRIDSNLAEVVWYSYENPADNPDTTEDETFVNGQSREPGMRTVYRRVLLIAPWLPAQAVIHPQRMPYDGKVSVHRELLNPADPTDLRQIWVPNTLADLTRREYRFAHELDYSIVNWDFPHELDLRDVNDIYDREYAVLDNALAFDVRVFDPGAPVYVTSSGTTVEPTDVGWLDVLSGTFPGAIGSYGAYVDLGWGWDVSSMSPTFLPPTTAPTPPVYSIPQQLGWHPRFPLNASTVNFFRGYPAVYDTWTWHYENDGRDQDDTNGNDDVDDAVSGGIPYDPRTGAIDEGTNGRDDPLPTASGTAPSPANGVNGVDDPLERETSPPYPVPLRGVKVVLRVYERDARQIRESSVTNSFVP